MKNVIIDGVEYAPVIKEEVSPIRINNQINFEVHPLELSEINWEDAKKACAELGEGWRLPTRAELLLIYEARDTINNLYTHDYYWSSTEGSLNNAWLQCFTNGYTYTNVKSDTFRVRAVRTI